MIIRWSAFALVLLSGRSALAQQSQSSVVERSPAQQESTSLPRIHDGFYATFHVGPSYFSASAEPEGSSAVAGSREFSGPSLTMRVALGGTFGNRVVLGAMLAFEPVLSLSAKDESGEEFDTYGAKFTLRQQGALVDYYFLPRGGFHLLGSIGFAQLAVTRTETDDDVDDYPSGTYWMLGFGHEWWAADSASFGVLASVTDGSLEVQELTRVDVDLFSFGLALTATIN